MKALDKTRLADMAREAGKEPVGYLVALLNEYGSGLGVSKATGMARQAIDKYCRQAQLVCLTTYPSLAAPAVRKWYVSVDAMLADLSK